MASQVEDHEKMVNDMRKKQTQAVNELEEQIEAVKKSKGKFEKDVHRLNAELIDTSEQVEEFKKLKVRKSVLLTVYSKNQIP
jgi:septal ring factor EnvC (AmiA/AmiB activator)